VAGFTRSREKINSVADLLSLSQQFSRLGPPGGVYFRGQHDAGWGLRPSIGRGSNSEFVYGGRTITRFTLTQEKNLLHRFRRHAYFYANRILSEWEALFLARHHYLPVRLLDWTSNPLIALYTACERGDNRTDAAVWAFRRRRSEKYDIDVLTDKKSPLKIKGVKIIFPFYGSSRITAQGGVFTIQDNPWRDLVSYFSRHIPRRNFDLEELTKWSVPARSRARCIEELERLGINARTVFPDLDGLAKGLWQTEVIRRGRIR
jgi:hypothetical protein